MPSATTSHEFLHFFFFQAAHAVVQLQETGRAVHKVKTTSLNAMCEHYDLPANPFKGK